MKSPGYDHAPVRIEAQLASTMDLSREKAAIGNTREGLAGCMVIARTQTGGRGRYGNRWSSPPGGLYLSLIVRPRDRSALDCWPDRLLPWLPLTAMLAMLRCIELLLPAAAGKLGLKWPNDLYLGDRKLAGVLVEGGLSQTREPYAIVGLGLNIAHAADLPPTATSLEAAGVAPLPTPEKLAHQWRRTLYETIAWPRGKSAAKHAAAGAGLKKAVEAVLLGRGRPVTIGFREDDAAATDDQRRQTTSGRLVELNDRAEAVLEGTPGKRITVSEGHLLKW